MKRLLLILILTLSFQSLTNADDISDFEIEGISIGDSLTDYFTKKEILRKLKNTNQYYKNNEYKLIAFNKSSTNYDGLKFHLRANDKTYKIYQMAGYKKINFKECIVKKDKISNELAELFGASKRKDYKIKNHSYDKSGNSKTISNFFNLSSGIIRVMCTDWSEKLTKEKNWNDKLTIGIASNEFKNWMNNKAYK